MRSAASVGAGIEEASGFQALKVLPVGGPGRGPAGGQGGAFPSDAFLSEDGLEDLGRFPPLGFGGGSQSC